VVTGPTPGTVSSRQHTPSNFTALSTMT
jgi:hypothetical protein